MFTETKPNLCDQNLFEKICFGDFEFEDESAMDTWEDYGFIKKDIFNGDLLKVTELISSNDKTFQLLCANGDTIECIIKKERKFFDINNIRFQKVEGLIDWLKTDDAKEWFLTNTIYAFMYVDKFNVMPSLIDAHYDSKKEEFLQEIKNTKKVYTAKVLSKNNGGFLVDIAGVNAFLPGSLAAANKILDFDYYINKEIPVMVEDYIKDGDTFIVSNKKYINHILPEKLSQLNAGDKVIGEITGTIKFGIFLEFSDILTGLLHTSEMCTDTYYKFKNNEFSAGQKIEVYIKEITEQNKIIFTDRNETDVIPTIYDFKDKCENTIQEGEVISIKPNIGSFIKFTLDDTYFTGLLHLKEYREDTNPIIGDKLNLLITKVDCENKKIFLKLTDEIINN